MFKATEIAKRVKAYLNDPEQINDEQRNAVYSSERLTVVRACPGSGKTRLFAARFAYEVTHWGGKRGGVAALSFTNVAQQEITKRVNELGIPAGYPHFVGTIDSFLLRFVVMRFGQEMINLRRFSHPVEDGDFTVQPQEYRYGTDNQDSTHLSCFRLESGQNNGVLVFVKPYQSAKSREVPNNFSEKIVEAKKQAWLETGQMTYSDVCAVAWKLLRKDHIRDLVTSRFPVILIDEFQDTGGMREACIKLLFSSKNFQHGMVVGDPDQCIMEFAGARPQLFVDFERFNNTKALLLTKCYRSHQGITKIVSHLQRAVNGIEACRIKDSFSKTILVTHDHTPRTKDLEPVVKAFKNFLCGIELDKNSSAIITWNGSDVERLIGSKPKSCPLAARRLKMLYHGLLSLKIGNAYKFFQLVERIFSDCVFENLRPSDIELESRALTRREWKRLIWRIAREACVPLKEESVQDWQKKIKDRFEIETAKILGKSVKLGQKLSTKVENTKDKDKILSSPMSLFFTSDETTNHDYVIDKVHQVKGKEFDAVCFFVPQSAMNELKAMASWFGYLDALGNEINEPVSSGEARRVAYVAMTRAKRILMVVIPENWYSELSSTEKGRAFIESFDNKTEVKLRDLLS